jgi:pimeloyl-ACP methyl ester carboxylesterase
MPSIQTIHAVSADGTKIFAEAIGNPSNPVVVFVHGFSSSGLVFEKQFANSMMQENLYQVRSLSALFLISSGGLCLLP